MAELQRFLFVCAHNVAKYWRRERGITLLHCQCHEEPEGEPVSHADVVWQDRGQGWRPLSPNFHSLIQDDELKETSAFFCLFTSSFFLSSFSFWYISLSFAPSPSLVSLSTLAISSPSSRTLIINSWRYKRVYKGRFSFMDYMAAVWKTLAFLIRKICHLIRQVELIPAFVLTQSLCREHSFPAQTPKMILK